MKKLPIGIQIFQKIREKNYIYLDKQENFAVRPSKCQQPESFQVFLRRMIKYTGQ